LNGRVDDRGEGEQKEGDEEDNNAEHGEAGASVIESKIESALSATQVEQGILSRRRGWEKAYLKQLVEGLRFGLFTPVSRGNGCCRSAVAIVCADNMGG
jgi:hypothetical protein